MVEHDNSCRIMIVDVNNVLYHIPGRVDGYWSRCEPKVSGGGCKIFVKVEILEKMCKLQTYQ